MKKDLQDLFKELHDTEGILEYSTASLLAVQVIALNPKGNNLVRHVGCLDEQTGQAYREASGTFTGETKSGEPERSLVFLEPNEFGYCKTIQLSQPHTAGNEEPSQSKHCKKYNEDDFDYDDDDDIKGAEKLKRAKSQESPGSRDGGSSQVVTTEHLERYFRRCLAECLFNQPGDIGTLVWLHSKVTEDKITSLFAVFDRELNEGKDGVLWRLDHFLQRSTTDYYTRRLRQRALETTISNIFARNFAHNIGSHVASNATNEKVKERIRDLYCR